MPLDFSSRSETVSVPASFQTGFSEVGGAATGVNLNIAGKTKVGKGGTLQPIVNLSDHGAIASSREFADGQARAAFDFAESASADSARAVTDLGRAAFEFADVTGSRQRDTLEDALGFGRSAFDFTERATEQQSDFARDLFGDSLAAVSGVLREGQAQLGNTVSNLNAIAREQSTSSDERVQSIARVAIFVAAGVAAILGLAFAFKGAR